MQHTLVGIHQRQAGAQALALQDGASKLATGLEVGVSGCGVCVLGER